MNRSECLGPHQPSQGRLMRRIGTVRYISSRYNYPVHIDGVDGIYLFNALTAAFIHVPEPLLRFVEELALKEPVGLDELPDAAADFFSQLEGGGFYTPWTLDERQLLRERFESDFQPGVFTLAVTATAACNLACAGCRSNGNKTGLTPGVSEHILREAQRVINHHDVSLLRVWWLGGEPLLNLPELERLSQGLIRLAEGAHIPFKAKLITNGLLLDDSAAERLAHLNINDVVVNVPVPVMTEHPYQLCLDHSSRLSGAIRGIRAASQRFHVYARIQMDERGLTEALAVLEQLEKNGCLTGNPFPVIPFPAFDGQWGEICNSKLFSLLPFADRYEDVFQFQLEVLKRIPGLKPAYVLELPRTLNRACAARSDRMLQITPEGNMYRCGVDYYRHGGAANPVHIGKSSGDSESCLQWVSKNPLDIPVCRDCGFLPLCMGGCPYGGFHKNDYEMGETCRLWHRYIDGVLRQAVGYIGAW